MVVNIAMCLSLEKIDSDVLEELCQLYLEAFPEEERRPLEKWLKLIDEEPMFRILTVMKNGNFVGFMTYWTFPDFTYVEHFAIKPSYRGGGLGGVALKLFLELQDQPVVLEVELPTTLIAQKRICFYEKYHFVRLPEPYQQPPYRSGDSWLPMAIMYYSKGRSIPEIEKIKKLLYEYVYKVKNNA